VQALFIRTAAQMFGLALPREGIDAVNAGLEETGGGGAFERFALVATSVYTAMAGDFGEARRLADRAMILAEGSARGSSSRFRSSFAATSNSSPATPQSRSAPTREEYRVLDDLRDEAHKSTAAVNLARALSRLGRLDEAETFARTAREVAAEDDLASQVMGRAAEARIMCARGRHAQAIALAREAVAIFREAEAPNWQGDAWMELAEILRAAREALGLYERKGNEPASAAARAFLESHEH
jgi:tetratricopeptide (TPR) repeat protein